MGVVLVQVGQLAALQQVSVYKKFMKLKSKIFASFLLSLFALFLAVPVLAAPNINELTPGIAAQAGYDKSDASSTALSEKVGGIIKIVMTLVGTIFLALTVYAGFLWMTASGNEEQVTKATSILTRAVIGLIIVVAAYGITTFVVMYTVGSSQGSTQSVGGAAAVQGGTSFWDGFGEGWSNGWKEFKGGF